MFEGRTSAKTSGNFTIYYFASASSFTFKDTETLPAPMKLLELFPVLEKMYPGIKEKVLCSCGVSLDGEYVNAEADTGMVIGCGAEVAIIPPVSSG
jgi:molybdopterin converting factor small subunit